MPKPASPLPKLETLRKIFRYDPDTGAIYNLVSRTSRKQGERAESEETGGYLCVSVYGRLYRAHRVAWYLAYGREPGNFIDHINGNRGDNRLSNLRLADHAMNMRNRDRPAHNTSGFKGVSFRRNGKWRAYITVTRTRHYLGDHGTPEDAAAVVREARARMHGEFARD